MLAACLTIRNSLSFSDVSTGRFGDRSSSPAISRQFLKFSLHAHDNATAQIPHKMLPYGVEIKVIFNFKCSAVTENVLFMVRSSQSSSAIVCSSSVSTFWLSLL